MLFKGTITALITPFIGDEVDEEGLADNVRFQIEQGISGILVLGSTGEGATLTQAEREKVISIAVKISNKRVPILVGTGHSGTRETIERTNRAAELGADMAVIVAPSYNKPSQEGIYRHFRAISENSQIPLSIYNVPSRTGVNIETSTIKRLAEFSNIVGVKEASGNICQVGELFVGIAKERENFSIWSGDDILTMPMMALGAKGVISVLSNLLPSQVISLVNAALNNDFKKAQEIHYDLLPLFKMAFIETNPVPIKEAMSICGMPAGRCRLPLCELSKDNRAALNSILELKQLLPSKI